MSVVVKHEILECIKSGELKFTPALDELQFRPHAVDLRLGNILGFQSEHLAPKGTRMGAKQLRLTTWPSITATLLIMMKLSSTLVNIWMFCRENG